MTRKEFLQEAIKEMAKYERAWNVYKRQAGCTKAELKRKIKEYNKELETL